MKAHKYWSISAFLCMLMTMISGYDSRLRKTHPCWALGAFGCMVMSVYTGHKMTRRKPKKKAATEPEKAENTESKEETENG